MGSTSLTRAQRTDTIFNGLQRGTYLGGGIVVGGIVASIFGVGLIILVLMAIAATILTTGHAIRKSGRN